LEVFNRALALERLDGDSTRLEDLLGAFQKNVPYVLEELESAWKKQDRERVENLAIELRESVRRIGAEGMEDLAARMVEAARPRTSSSEIILTQMGMELDWLFEFWTRTAVVNRNGSRSG
jgi:HPt (histidine-containing phosphotransfer) domain-containing protein